MQLREIETNENKDRERERKSENEGDRTVRKEESGQIERLKRES